MTAVRYLLLAIFLLLGTVQDFLEHRISSRLVLVGMLSEILIRLYEDHVSISFLCSVAADLFLPMIILFPLFLLHALGAGDIRLCALIGCSIGLTETLSVIYLAFILGAARFLMTFPRKEYFHREPFAWTFLAAFFLLLWKQKTGI